MPTNGNGQAVALSPDDIKVGLKAHYERMITEEDVLAFARNSGDENPLHVDADYARKSNFRKRIVHGAFQVSLASTLVGMQLPGQNVLLGSVNAKFPSPLYFPCRVRVQGEVVTWNKATGAGSLKVVVYDAESQVPTAEVSMGFLFHQNQKRSPQNAAAPVSAARLKKTDQKIILVTGASGGIGSALVLELAQRYRVIALIHRNPLPASVQGLRTVSAVEADLQTPGWEEALSDVLQESPLYGILHAAWPGLPHGGLLHTDTQVLEQQLSFGVAPVALARFLFSHAEPDGGRLILLGSSAGRQRPFLTYASYFLGKSVLQHTARLLAPELARKKITVNVINPSFMSVGVNKQVGDRQVAMETAVIPMGRLCQPADIAGMVRYLMSPEAAFVSGQVINLTGAQL
jgi:NAD(P)-dependent dehydrogenase (short-subunit alcohol dehydrogenase family)/acyl dehydratase